ncbi:hypothetical protein DFH07DRAFT_950601 [Mycena maculata]|uniref:Uncharacterized protein n=1 Tax=Mycena maculata TaxID=230809 RepID=A0AAD7K767_9AGAR|nr:hypothetical protein DFH07DRAFT_950601 [Mycena maculata]
MALQTEVHSSTSTPSSTGSAPDPSNTDSDSSDQGFSLSGSPPLIIAFLAVGFFGAAMIAFFGWRRAVFMRTRWEDPTDPPRPEFGETPKLWDIWCPRERAQDSDTREWRDIQPLAATVWDNTPSPVLLNNGTAQSDTILAAAFAHLRRRYRRHNRSDDDIALDTKLGPPLVRLQVAVTIAMPCPDVAGMSSGGEPDEEPWDYSIGLYEIPWKNTDSSVA